MSTVLITGGTGMIGQALTKSLLKKGYEVIILTRNKERQKPAGNIIYA
ncbi:MAG: SDR family NAD(P)-dependent oxidoreductase, partial [Chitinophagaceae bacterium]